MPPIHWKDIEEIAIALCEKYPDRDPLAVRFTELTQMVEALPEFEPQPGHCVNEQILEAIQAAWHEEKEDADGDEGEPGYQPNNPFRG